MSKKKNKKKTASVMKNKYFSKTQIILLICSLMSFAILALLVVTNNISWFDNSVYSLVSKVISKPMTLFFKSITVLCDTSTIIGLLIIIMIFMKDKKKASLVTINVILCVLLNQITKHLFLRSRPLNIALIKQGGYSFPSGHSMISFAFLGLSIYMINNSKMSIKHKRCLSILLGVLILLIGISRIYLGVHFASDVISGFVLSFAHLLVFINLIYKRNIN